MPITTATTATLRPLTIGEMSDLRDTLNRLADAKSRYRDTHRYAGSYRARTYLLPDICREIADFREYVVASREFGIDLAAGLATLGGLTLKLVHNSRPDMLMGPVAKVATRIARKIAD